MVTGRDRWAADPPPPEGWTPGDEFHRGEGAIHTPRPGEPAPLVARRADLAHVVYDPAHPNPAAPGWMNGAGQAFSVWVASEQPGTAQGWSGARPVVIEWRADPLDAT